MHSARAAAVLTSAALAACALAVCALASPPAEACTTFCLRDGGRLIFGKNYDWHVGEGLLVVNKRGVAKTAMAPEGEAPARWVSRHGSVTFNQYGREFPAGGMNEAGLVVELMWLDGTRYPDPDERGALGGLQWIQLQLDTAATVDEVLASDARIRIASPTPLHYLVADATGRAATVEFLNGRLAARTGEDLPVAALANHSYEESLDYYAGHETGGRCLTEGPASLARFARAAARVQAFRATGTDPDLRYAFRTLESVAQGGATRWSIVYEIDARKVHYRTAGNRSVRSLGLQGLDFSCGTEVVAVDLDRGAGGDVLALLEPLTETGNLDLIRASFGKTRFLRETPDEFLREQAAYPGTTRCAP